MKHILFVNNNMHIGGVQKALLNLLWEIHTEYEITLLLFYPGGEYMASLPADVHVITASAALRFWGMSRSDAVTPQDRLGRAFWAGLTHLLGRRTAFDLLRPLQRNFSGFDAAISFLHSGPTHTFYGGCNEFVLHCVQTPKKITFLHCDYARIQAACLFLVWVPMLMKRSRHGAHLRLLAGGLCAALILLSFSGVQELLRIMDTRFSYSANVSQLTTGRTDLWHGYLEELSRNIPLLLLGQGYSKTRLDMGASHNTILQGIYQFGLVGFPLLWAWVYSALKKIFPASAQVHLRGAPLLLLCIGVVLPWMALDILFFDELFLLPAYVLVGSTYTITQETSPR